MSRYSMSKTVAGTFPEVKARVVSALKTQGFGVLTEIDVQRTLREKIGAELEPYIILGACNPQAAYKALSVDRDIGLLLPCNVVLRSLEGKVEVSILDPTVMFSVVEETTQRSLSSLPVETKERLQAALDSLGGEE